VRNRVNTFIRAERPVNRQQVPGVSSWENNQRGSRQIPEISAGITFDRSSRRPPSIAAARDELRSMGQQTGHLSALF
jgi:hypothetical protein